MTKKKEKESNMLVKLFLFLLFIGFIFILYSYFIGTKGLFIREYAIINSKIPDNFNGFKIVHFSDLHYGTTIHKKEIEHIVETINNLKPDIVVFTGDLLDERITLSDTNINDLITNLNKIDASINKYIISGNHDIHPKYNYVLDNIDFINLDNKNTEIYYKGINPLILVGIADEQEFDFNPLKAFNYQNENNNYTILLTHEPDSILKLNEYNYDLVLAGHSHNGQIRIPLIGKIITPEGSKKYYDEKYELNNHTMYISGGIGTSALPLRFMVKPSINLYRLYNH